MSNYGDDDDVVSLLSGGDYRDQEDAVEYVGDLREEVTSCQRHVLAKLSKMHMSGSMEVPRVAGDRQLIGERVFRVNRLMDWESGEPEALLAALHERVRTRLSAAMGVGKSTKLGPIIASRLNCRVLMVGLDAHCMRQSAEYIAARNRGVVKRRWSSTRAERLCSMTYADFVATVASPKRTDLFASFDVVIFDEAFEAKADVYVAKKCFATYAGANTSLILTSATIRTDFATAGAESSGMGKFLELESALSVGDAVDSGKLVTKYLRDRCMVMYPTDDGLDQLFSHYVDNGADVRILDSSASREDEMQVEAWLQGDSMTPRVLLAHTAYAIGYNFSVEFCIIWPYRPVLVEKDGCWQESIVPMTPAMVAQAKARTGRNMTGESGGVVMAPERDESGVELYPEERFLAFVKLVSAGIKPLRVDWADCYEVFPEGLTTPVAQVLLKVNLPVTIAAMFLGSDGRYASKYASALQVFAHMDHYLLPSKDELPTSYSLWVEGKPPIGNVANNLKVPVHAEGFLGMHLYGVAAIAESLFTIERWRPARHYLQEADDSGDEAVSRGAVRRMRRIENPTNVPAPIVTPPSTFTYRGAIADGDPAVRRAGMQFKPNYADAIRQLESTLEQYEVPDVMPYVTESAEGEKVGVIENDGVVDSPGGSVVCTLPFGVCEKLNKGTTLTPDELLAVVVAARDDVQRFVASKLFLNMAGPWESILSSLLAYDVVELVVRRGVSSTAYDMVGGLSRRFNVEVANVLATSNVFNRRFLGIFNRKPSVNKLMRALVDGKFDGIAQTDRFLNRVKLLKSMLNRCLVFAEEQNVYLPMQITQAQRGFHVAGTDVLGRVGVNMTPMPNNVGSHVRQRSDGSDMDGVIARLRSRTNF